MGLEAQTRFPLPQPKSAPSPLAKRESPFLCAARRWAELEGKPNPPLEAPKAPKPAEVGWPATGIGGAVRITPEGRGFGCHGVGDGAVAWGIASPAPLAKHFDRIQCDPIRCGQKN